MRSLDRRQRVLLLTLFAVAALVRINNVAVFPSLRAPDGFGHFTYIWYLAETGRIPGATSGWSFFHPPLYYALMTAVWRVFENLDPVVRLKIGIGVLSVAGLVHAVTGYILIRRRIPENGTVRIAAAAMMLFLPVHLYSAGYVGNEALNALLCSVSLLALVSVLDRPTSARAALLGLCLGCALLTKFTAVAITAAAYLTIAMRASVKREFASGIRVLVVTSAVMLSVCGWFYVRNIIEYGNPVQLSRDTLAVRRIENLQTQGRRGIGEYVLFDPLILFRPQWPRGLPLVGPIPLYTPRSALRESVWTGAFANTFFDSVGGQVIPPVTTSEVTRRSGQILLTLGLIPSALVLLGLLRTLRRLRQRGWEDTDVAMLSTFTTMIVIFMYSTKAVPMHAAVKATYLTPITAVFSYWFAQGLDLLMRRAPKLAALAFSACGLLAVASVTVFALGVFVGRGYLANTPNWPVWQNAYGVVEYAGGRKEDARRLFAQAASANWHLGHENVAAMALDDGHALEAMYHLRMAEKLQPGQSFGLPEDQQAYDRMTRAEYRNTLADIYYRVGWLTDSLDAARESHALVPTIPESAYNEGVILLRRAAAADAAATSSVFLEEASRAFARAFVADPTFEDAARMESVALAGLGRCDESSAARTRAERARSGKPRPYPYETGPGDLHSSGLHRRRQIEPSQAQLRAALALSRCEKEAI